MLHFCVLFHEIEDFIDDFMNLVVFFFCLGASRKAEKIFDNGLAILDMFFDDFQIVVFFRIRRFFSQQQLRVSQNDSHGIIYFMGDACRKLPQRRKFVRLGNLQFHQPPLFDVLDQMVDRAFRFGLTAIQAGADQCVTGDIVLTDQIDFGIGNRPMVIDLFDDILPMTGGNKLGQAAPHRRRALPPQKLIPGWIDVRNGAVPAGHHDNVFGDLEDASVFMLGHCQFVRSLMHQFLEVLVQVSYFLVGLLQGLFVFENLLIDLPCALEEQRHCRNQGQHGGIDGTTERSNGSPQPVLVHHQQDIFQQMTCRSRDSEPGEPDAEPEQIDPDHVIGVP